MPFGPPESASQHFRAEARAAHPDKQCAGKARGPNVPSDPVQMVSFPGLLLDDFEPTQPPALVAARPKRSVAVPESG